MQQARATVRAACASAGSVRHRSDALAEFTGNSGRARSCTRATTGSHSTASTAHYSCGNFAVDTDFKRPEFEDQYCRRSL
jgi:hypothetical protein